MWLKRSGATEKQTKDGCEHLLDAQPAGNGVPPDVSHRAHCGQNHILTGNYGGRRIAKGQLDNGKDNGQTWERPWDGYAEINKER